MKTPATSIWISVLSRGRKVLAETIFVLFLCASVFALFLSILKAAGTLPAPPLTGIYCVDEKFRFLAETDLSGVDLLAVGSSATWRSLDLAPFVEKGLTARPINAAACELQAHHIAFLTEFLLEHLTDAKTVVSVLAPGDFTNCPEDTRAFFDTRLTGAYVFANLPSILIYALNFRPGQLLEDAGRIGTRRSDASSRDSLVLGAYGFGPIEIVPEPKLVPNLDERCFLALSALEEELVRRDVALVVVSLPSVTLPDLQDGADAFETRLRASLVADRTIHVSSRAMDPANTLELNVEHLHWSTGRSFSSLLADRIGTSPMTNR